MLNLHALYHLPDQPWATPVTENCLQIRLRTAAEDHKQVRLFYKDRYDWQSAWQVAEMEVFSKTELFAFYEAAISLPKNRYRYYFEVMGSQGEVVYLDERGPRQEELEVKERTAFQYAYIGPADVYQPKKTLAGQVVYQIFPERFANGDPKNDPPGTQAWGGVPRQRVMFGGDLRGIIDHLDYLADLGVDVIYLTPVFASTSNHKYNIYNYYAIDESFGTLADAKELVTQAHQRNLKVIFDAVFNHTGHDFFAFQDVFEKGEDSDYVSWYHIHDLPLTWGSYDTFADDVYTMPKLRTENPAVRDYFFKVGQYWIREIGIDGWRLDVCDEVDHRFWQGFKEACEAVNPEAVLVGEIMHEAGSYLRGNELDSIMNYPFLYAGVDYFAKRAIGLDDFLDALAKSRSQYSDAINHQMWNLLGSHDTPRFLTRALGQRDRLKLASAFQFVYLGAPYIYYGDEIGLDGGEDPYCRRCMIWDQAEWKEDLYEHYKTLIRLRKAHPALVSGNFREILRQSPCFVIQRQLPQETIWCAFNNSDADQTITIPRRRLKNLITGESQATDQLTLDPMAFAFYQLEE